MASTPPTPAPPAAVQALIHDDEEVLFYVQPIRRAGGLGVWLIASLGMVFLLASVPATMEVIRLVSAARQTMPTVAWILIPLALVFLLFSGLLVVWPAVSSADLRRTHVVITPRRVLQVKLPLLSRRRAPRVHAWTLRECRDLSVTRRRGASATLVLQESLRERRSDGQTVYEWQALHGLPRADEALALLRRLRDATPR